MNSIRQHIPSFCEGFDQSIVNFNTLEELLAIDFVKRFSEHDNFHQYCVSDNHLMAEYRGGRQWWVIGTLKDPNVGLPQWDHGIVEVYIDGKPAEVKGEDVSVYSGDEVRMRDGRILQRRREKEHEH